MSKRDAGTKWYAPLQEDRVRKMQSYTLDADVVDALAAEAKRTGETKSQIVEDGLRAELARRRKRKA